MNIKRGIVVVGALGLLTACGSTGAVTGSASEAKTDAPSSSSQAEQVTTPAPTTAAKPDLTAAFGQLRNYEDGITLSVSAPEGFDPDEYAAGIAPGSSYLRFDVSVTNGTSAPWDASQVYVTAQMGGAEAQSVYDSQNGINGGPSTMVLPGQSVTWPVVFGAADVSNPVVQVTPGFQYDASLFYNK